jgi:hypothetical protein
MDEFFNNKRFISIVDKLPYGKVRTVEIMKEIKEENPELTIEVFICVLHKRINPANSYGYECSVIYDFCKIMG